MNLNAEMLPGIMLLLAGAVMTFGAQRLSVREKNVSKTRILGVCLAFAGAILVFL